MAYEPEPFQVTIKVTTGTVLVHTRPPHLFDSQFFHSGGLIKIEMNSVYILGAGCSAKYYPLARDFRQELSKYADDLSKRPNCKRLKDCISKTVTLMERYASPTIDRLILQIIEDVS